MLPRGTRRVVVEGPRVRSFRNSARDAAQSPRCSARGAVLLTNPAPTTRIATRFARAESGSGCSSAEKFAEQTEPVLPQPCLIETKADSTQREELRQDVVNRPISYPVV